MKKNISFNLNSGEFFKIFFSYYLISIILFAIYFSCYIFGITNINSNPILGIALIGVALFILIPIIIVSLIYTIILSRKLIQAVSFDGNNFDFKGQVGKYVKLNLIGLLLTIVTCGIYYAWFTAKINKYFVEETYYKEKKFEFTGNGVNLFIIILLWFYVPMVILSILLTIGIVAVTFASGTIQSGVPSPFLAIIMVIFYIFILIAMIPFYYKMNEWFFNNIKYENNKCHWNTKVIRTSVFLLLQIFLILITCGIYYAAAYIKIYKYFVDKTEVLGVNDTVIGNFSFEGTIGKGFVLLFVQILLTIITLGIYTPWFYKNAGKWIAENTYYDEK